MKRSLNSEILSDLRERRRETGGVPDVSLGMSQLINPDGERESIVTTVYAAQFCQSHPGWTSEPL